MTETTVCTFNINNHFIECVNKFDLDEAPARKAKNIKVIFRGASKDKPHKAIVIFRVKRELQINIFKKFLITLKKWRRYVHGCSK